MMKRGFGDDLWCIVRDVNIVSFSSERKKATNVDSEVCRGKIRDFNQFIEYLNLIELLLLGSKFTWFRPNGSALSFLDCFLVLGRWLEKSAGISQWALNRDVFDHCPIVIRYSDLNRGPKLFCFKNYLLNHKGFSNVVRGAGLKLMFRVEWVML